MGPGARFTNGFFPAIQIRWKHSTAVVPCKKICSDHCIRIEVRVKRHFHRIWIAMEKPLVKRAPGPVFYQYGLTLILAWVINDMPSYLWDGITHPLPNFDSWTIDFWELLSNSISNFA